MDRRVSLVACDRYEVAQVEEAVRRAVDLLGGMASFVQAGQRVLVKPNLLLPSNPERAIVTHPAVLRAVVGLVQEAGGRAIIADNPGAAPPNQLAWRAFYEKVGYATVARETGAELNLHVSAQQQPHPGGELLKRVDISQFVGEADVIINVPKLKSHGLMRFTGAVKNLFGTVPGAAKFGYHARLRQADHFAEMLLDLVSYVRPALTVMDAVVGMDGQGPSAGDPFPMGAILAGPDPVAVDVAAISLAGHDPLSVPTVAAAARRSWHSGQVNDLTLLGDSLDRLRVQGFRLPAGGGERAPGQPGLLRRLGTRHLVDSPVITERCVGCGICIDSCPVHTITSVNGRALIDLSGCIRCYCCHELCPEQAIDLRQPWLRRAAAWVGW